MPPLPVSAPEKELERDVRAERGDIEGAATVGVPPVGHMGTVWFSELRADCHQETYHQEAVGQELQWELKCPPPSGMV